MKSDEYIKLFTPFAGEDDLYTREFDKHLTVVKAEDSPKFYGKKPLVLDIVFSKFVRRACRMDSRICKKYIRKFKPNDNL